MTGTGASQFGGFFGENEGSATIETSYSSGIVSSTGGGFGGIADASTVLTNDYFDTDTSGQMSAVQR